ncbi:MAG: FKBP-type peptidyl-prolyl cis-trans isomerase [Desulfobulbaceae bacterium]|nr:FKBP-type peptidyl-prolyl cis-trans isomerase [Desulfobulbaceae bacterium]
MTQAKSGDTVQIHYVGRLDDDTVFDSSEGKTPLEFELGSDEVIQGFNDAVIGMSIGEKKTTTIPAEKAYGPHQKEMVMELGHDQFPPEIVPEIGQKIQLTQPDGQEITVIVTTMNDTNVTLDANPPLAGKDLSFDIELVEIA